jgi:hypothetical protein
VAGSTARGQLGEERRRRLDHHTVAVHDAVGQEQVAGGLKRPDQRYHQLGQLPGDIPVVDHGAGT